MQSISKEELEKLIKTGKAKKVHISPIERVLQVRGPLQKESIDLLILERLISNYEHLTEPSYSDNPDIGALLFHLKKNLDLGVSAAWNEFLKMINSGKTESEMWNDFWSRRDEERKI